MPLFKVEPEPLKKAACSLENSFKEMSTLYKSLESLNTHINEVLSRCGSTPYTSSVYQKSEQIITSSGQLGKSYIEAADELSRFILTAEMADMAPISLLTGFSAGILNMYDKFGKFNDFQMMADAEKISQEKLMAEIFGKVTPEEYAKLSSLAYQDENKINKELKKFKIGKVRLRKISGEIVHHYKSGLDAVIFQIGTSNNYIIAFRGTESNFITSFKDAYRDVKNDTTGVLGIPALSLTGNVWGSPDLAITGVKRGYSSSQDRDADKFIKKVKRQLGDNINLTFTGHSLGGWLADNQADKYNTTAVTFNAPRYTPGSKKEFLKNNNQKMVNFRVEGDLISEKHKKPINMKYSPGINISVPNVALESGLKPHEINRSFRFDKRGNILIDSKQREISNDIKLTDTAKVKDDLISKKQLENIENRVINNRIYSNHNRVDEKYTNDLLSKVNQMISNLEKMDKFQNMGDRYIPEELNKEEIGNYAKKLIKLQLNKKQLEKEVNSNLYDQDPFINHEYIKNLEINKIHSFEKEITEIEAKIDDLKHNYHTNDEKILNELKGYKHELEQLLQRSQK